MECLQVWAYYISSQACFSNIRMHVTSNGILSLHESKKFILILIDYLSMKHNVIKLQRM